jgi:hypothetical protein
MVLARASEEIGMDVTAKSLRAGWGGATVVRDLVVTMPLTHEVILSADTVRLSHTAVPWLVLGRSFDVRSVEIENPQVKVRRYETGRWNVRDVWDRLKAIIDSSQQTAQIALPRLAIHGAQVLIAESNEVTQTVGPIEFQAQPRGRLLWTFDLKLPSMAAVNGQLIEGGDWAHEIGFSIEGIGPLVHRLSGWNLSPIVISGQWEGDVSGDSLKGRIQLAKATFGSTDLQGDIRVEAGRDALTLRPGELVLRDPNLAGGEIHLAAGTILITREAVTVQQLAARTGALIGRFDGRWDMDTRVGKFSGSWVAGPLESPQYQGTCEVAVQSPRFGRTQVEASLTAQARTVAGDWTITAKVQGAGTDWQKSQWQVVLPQAAWSRNNRRAGIAGAVAQIDVNWPVIRLTSLHIPDAGRMIAGAEVDARTRRWSVHLDATALRLGLAGTQGIDARVIARGDNQEALVSELRVAAGERIVAAKGELSLADWSLKDVTILADWPGSTPGPDGPQAVRPAGQWHLNAGVSGHVSPPALTVEGNLVGQGIPVGRQTVPRVAVPIHTTVGAEQIHVATEPFDLLSGRWQLTGQYEFATELAQLTVVVDGISLKAAADIAGAPFACQGTAHAQMQLAVPSFQARQAVATGKWTAEDVNIPPLEAEKARGKLRIAGGLVRFEDIELEHDSGRARAGMEFRLDRPQEIIVEFTTQSWPVRLKDHPFSILADSQANLQVNTTTRAVQGQIGLSGGIWYKDQDLARIRVDAFLEGRTLDVHDLYAETLDGSIEGTARIALDRWSDSTATLKWSGLQPRSLQRWWQPFGKFKGEVSGGLVVERTDAQSRPLGSMRFTLNAQTAGGRYGPAEVNACRIVGYLDGNRLITDDGALLAFGGRINARARVSRHADAYYASTITDFNSLDLDQLVHVVDPGAGEHIGLVSGRISLLSSDRLALGGEGDIRLTQSDLGNNAVIDALHSALSLEVGKKQPAGTGNVRIQFAGARIVVPSFEYFNRGVEVRGAGQIKDVQAGGNSLVEGYAVAFTRVLKGVSLPGVQSLDRLMASLQTGTAAVQIEGTLEDVQVKAVPLPLVSGQFRRLLWAQLRE